MILIDTHTHIYQETFDEDRAEMIRRAIDRGLKYMLMPNVDSASTPLMLRVNKDWPLHCLPMMALHPCSVNENLSTELAHVRFELEKGIYCAVGETGIDLYWDKTHLEAQKNSFRQHILWALEFDLPLVIHARESFSEIFEIMDEFTDQPLKGVFHCFSGNLEQGIKCLSYPGFYLGIGGVITYKKSGLSEVLAQLATNRIMLETDAPYLSPVPYRGKRNEPSYLVYILDQIASTLGITVEKAAELSTLNACNLFKLTV